MSLFGAKVTNLCSKLAQNDPTLVKFTTQDAAFFVTQRDELDSNFQRLGMALKSNTIVTSISLGINDVLHRTDSEASAINRVQHILHFLEHSTTLQTVRLYDMEPYYPDGPRVPLLTAIMEAVSKNPSIQSVESSIDYLPVDLVTKLLTSNPTLRRLHVNLHVDDTLHGNVDAAVRALGSHPALQDINLSTSRDVPLAPFLQALRSSHSNVTSLHIECPSPLSNYTQDISFMPKKVHVN